MVIIVTSASASPTQLVRLLAPDQTADRLHAYIGGKQEEAHRDQLLRAQFRLFVRARVRL